MTSVTLSVMIKKTFFQTFPQGSTLFLCDVVTLFIQTGIGKGIIGTPAHTRWLFSYLPFTRGSSTKRQQSEYSMFRLCTQHNLIQSSSTALQ